MLYMLIVNFQIALDKGIEYSNDFYGSDEKGNTGFIIACKNDKM